MKLSDESPQNVQCRLEYLLQGHNYRPDLLARVADTRQSPDLRLRCAKLLSRAGSVYADDVIGAPANLGFECDFLTRLSQIAVANLGTELAGPLLGGIADSQNLPPDWSDPRLAADARGAAGVLSRAFPTTKPVDQFWLAGTLTQLSPESYRVLLPRAGSALTLVQPDQDFSEAKKQGSLHLVGHLREQYGTNHTLSLVLQPVRGGKDITFSIETPLNPAFDSVGEHLEIQETVPDNVRGKYHIFIRADTDGGDGLGFDVAF